MFMKNQATNQHVHSIEFEILNPVSYSDWLTGKLKQLSELSLVRPFALRSAFTLNKILLNQLLVS